MSLSLSPPSSSLKLIFSSTYCICGCIRLLSAIAHKHRYCEESDRAVIGRMISTLTGTLCADTAMLSGWAITFTQRSLSVAKRKVSSALWQRSLLEHLCSKNYSLEKVRISADSTVINYGPLALRFVWLDMVEHKAITGYQNKSLNPLKQLFTYTLPIVFWVHIIQLAFKIN